MKKITKGTMIREHGYGTYIDSKVITEPVENERGQLIFKSETETGSIIEYMKHPDRLTILEDKL
jgi:hypothetical protein